MKKKTTKSEINLLRSEAGKPAGHSSKAGLPDGWARRTFIVKEEHLEKLEALSYWQRKPLKELMDEALHAFLSGKQFKSVRS
ncbi:MAG TPA: hypothetical protein VLH08_20110 [Acidobacteriota bacterium]|jgi:hypothetical protein|nr:hypothetical protein [Acidobacteriota bacterium]